MFDTKRIGARIAELRKAKDMTQMELADQMLVSYQAVSNWERGNTMPDISKLGDLSHILGISIEELLDSKQQVEIVNKVVARDPDLKLKDIAEVAPVLKPSQVEEAVEANKEKDFDIDVLTAIAPFLSSKQLHLQMEKVNLEDLNDLIPLAPFLDEEDLDAIIAKQPTAKKSCSALIALAPFLSSEQTSKLASEALEGEDFEKLIGLAPFINEETIDTIALKLFDTGKHAGKLAALAPFLSSETIGKLAARIDPEEQKKYLVALAPFMDSSDLTQIAKEQMRKGNLKVLRAIMPFINGEELQ